MLRISMFSWTLVGMQLEACGFQLVERVNMLLAFRGSSEKLPVYRKTQLQKEVLCHQQWMRTSAPHSSGHCRKSAKGYTQKQLSSYTPKPRSYIPQALKPEPPNVARGTGNCRKGLRPMSYPPTLNSKP